MKGKDETRWLEGAPDHGRQALRQALDEASPAGDSALAKQRVWNRVQFPWAGPSRSPWRGALLLGAGAAAALAAVAVVIGTGLFRQPPVEPVATAPAPRPVAHPELVPLPSAGNIAVTTGPGQRARHRLPRGVDAELAPRTALVPGDEAIAPEVRVGQVRFSVPHQERGKRYVVRAGPYQVAVLGTTFLVSVDEKGVSVAVESGVVEVEDAGSGRRLDRLAPGERWSSETPSPRPVVRAPAPRAPDPGPLEEARAAGRRGDARRALELYQRLANGGGPLAETALYEMADIQDQNLHDERGALASFERYRARYPRGLLRAEADYSIVELLIKSGASGRASEEAEAFLRLHPQSERRGQIARIAGDLARSRGDCGRAVALYEAAGKSALSPTDADDAAFHRAACLASLRDGRAGDAARQYLQRFPAGTHADQARRLLEGSPVAPNGR